MSPLRPLPILLLLLLFTAGGCFGCLGGGSNDDSNATSASDDGNDDSDDGDNDDGDNDDGPQSLTDALNDAQEALNQVTEGGSEPVDFRDLKDELPEELDDMTRTNSEGQKSGAFGIKVSEAKGTYEGDPGRITISIIDLGTLQGLARMSYAAWLVADVDRESDSGYERTTKYENYPAYEKVEARGDGVRCAFSVFVGERALVNIEGDVDDAERCEDARDEVDYDDIEDLVTATES